MDGLAVDQLSVRFEEIMAVDQVSLSLPAGEILVVLGPSGCGKSSLLRAIAGLVSIESGSIAYDGVDLVRVSTHKRGFALMFQDGQLFPHLDVGANVAYPLRLQRMPRQQIKARVAELLTLVDLEGHQQRRPETLSGGERQRVALARALAASPRMVLLDEPLSALDKELRERLAGDLKTILARSGTSAVMVTHDQEEAFAVADRLAVMRDGQLVSQGAPDQVWRHPPDAWTARFLGYAAVLTAAELGVVGLDRVVRVGSLDSLAIRRSALVVKTGGDIRGVVKSVTATPDQVRLQVELPNLGLLPAIAQASADAQVGAEVELWLDETKTAVIRCRDLGSAP